VVTQQYFVIETLPLAGFFVLFSYSTNVLYINTSQMKTNMTTQSQATQGQLTNLPINNLQPNPLQPRGKIEKDQLEEMVSSVKAYGILEPIVVAQTPAGYQIIAGERRWRAAKLAGLKEVPVVVKQTTPKGMLEMALIENVQRVDLSPIERAQAFQQLIRDFKFTHGQISDRIGKSAAYVSNSLRLLNLPDAIKDGLAGGQIMEGHARAIVGLEDERLMIEVYKQVLKESASVRRAEELVRNVQQNLGAKLKRQPSAKLIKNEELEAWQSNLQRIFGHKSKVNLMQSSRQTKVTFIFKGTPEETQEELQKIMKLTQKAA
jgi:ParB family chromosome partitioning protein